MSNLLVNTRDQQFVLYEQLGIEKFFNTKKYADYSKDTVDMILTLAEKMSLDVLMPEYVPGDLEEAKFKDGKVFVPAGFHDAYKKFVEAGWQCCMKSPDVGGQGMPLTVSTACFEFFDAANCPFIMYPILTNGAAWLLHNFGTERQTDTNIH